MFKFFNKDKKRDSSKPDTPEGGKPAGLFNGLKFTRNNLVAGIKEIFKNKRQLNSEIIEQLETKLLTSDVGVKVTQEVIEQLKLALKKTSHIDSETILTTIKQELQKILAVCDQPWEPPSETKPGVILLVGVNGSGKTTTIGKLAKRFQNSGRKVILAAGDTFRAAAIDQLKIWGERNHIPVIAQKPGADSAAVIYDALQAAKARNFDLLIADTAGRLHTQTNFMEELKKVTKILKKCDPNAPHEVLLILDATIGQNAITQVKQFNESIGVTGLCITKLDGTAKGGAIFAIAKESKIPIRYVGVGEGIDDLKTFDHKKFVDALFGDNHESQVY